MMRSGRFLLGLAVAPLAAGCGADLGGGAGIEARSANFVGYGRAAGSTKLGTPLNDHGFLIGGSLESRAEHSVGARYDAGVMLGWGSGPAAIGGRWGFETYGEFGTPIQSAIFRDGSCFFGAAIGVPYHVAEPRRVVDLNDSTWIATTHVEIVPLIRARVHIDHPNGGDVDTKIDLTAGLAFRLRIISDLF